MNSDSPQDKGKKGNAVEIYRDFAPYLTMGFQLAAAVLIFFFIGLWIDGRYGIDPWGKIGGIILGSTGGFIKFFVTVNRMSKKEETQKHDRLDTY
jgi:F0F1-type ATP synthase assembly protein I